MVEYSVLDVPLLMFHGEADVGGCRSATRCLKENSLLNTSTRGGRVNADFAQRCWPLDLEPRRSLINASQVGRFCPANIDRSGGLLLLSILVELDVESVKSRRNILEVFINRSSRYHQTVSCMSMLRNKKLTTSSSRIQRFQGSITILQRRDRKITDSPNREA